MNYVKTSRLFSSNKLRYVGFVLVAVFAAVLSMMQGSGSVNTASVTIGFIGDSITHGSDEGTAVNAEIATLGKEYAAVNRGIGGSSSKDWQSGRPMLVAALDDFKAKNVHIVSIMLGTNDARDDIATSPEEYKKHLTDIISSLLGSGGIERVIINCPPYVVPGSAGLWSESSVARLEAYMTQIGALTDGKKVLLGDTAAFGYFQNHADELVDGVHPTDAGYAQLGMLWAQAYARVLPTPSVWNGDSPSGLGR